MRVLQRTGGYVRVLDDDGVERGASVAADATDDAVIAAVVAARPPVLAGTTRAAVEQATLLPYWSAWWRWKTTRDEAQARSVPAAVLTALSTKVDAAWAEYLQAIQAWRAAT